LSAGAGVTLRAAVLRGIAASSGVGVGLALIIRAEAPDSQSAPGDANPETEWMRFLAAVELSRQDLLRAQGELRGLVDEAAAEMLDAYLLMHEDPALLGAVEAEIRVAKREANLAVAGVIDTIANRVARGTDSYLRERARDVRHVGDHILRHLEGRESQVDSSLREGEPRIVIARDLSPADAVGLLSQGVAGLATQLGSPASHTALLARTLAIPAIVAVPELLVNVAGGVPLILDGFQGDLRLYPTEDAAEQARTRQRRFVAFRERLKTHDDGMAKSQDGTQVGIWANLELAEEVSLASAAGVAGIGLFRSEFLYLEKRQPPTEEEQATVYRELVRAMAPRPVHLRTVDIGGEKLIGGGLRVAPPNPALGLRGIRLSLRTQDGLFQPQLRAMLKAASEGSLRILFPMVTDVTEFQRGRDAVERAISELRDQGVEVPTVLVGAMVEVPSAALGAAALARAADFLSVGSNDLTQYVMAADRANPAVAEYASVLHPAVLRLIRGVVEAADQHDTPVSLCGDMAADPIGLPVALGLGFRALSVSAPVAALAHEIVSRVNVSEATALVEECLELQDAAQVRAHALRGLGAALGSIWSECGLD